MRRKTLVLLSVVSAVAAAALAHAQTAPPSADAFAQRVDTLWSSGASIARMSLSVVRPSQTRTLEMRAWTRGTDLALVVVDAPAREQGTATLRRSRDLWMYLPRVARTIRVPPSMMLSSWMGSDFTNDDLTRSDSYRTDFTGSVVGRSTTPPGWLLRYDAKPGVVGLWQRVEFVTTDDGSLPVEARYYDRRMRLARTMRFEDVRTLSGRRIPTRLVLQPADRPAERTELRYLDLQLDANVPDGTFSLTELERER